MAKALSHSPLLIGNQERREGDWCTLCSGEVAMEGHHPEVGVWKDHGYLILKNLGENFF